METTLTVSCCEQQLLPGACAVNSAPFMAVDGRGLLQMDVQWEACSTRPFLDLSTVKMDDLVRLTSVHLGQCSQNCAIQSLVIA